MDQMGESADASKAGPRLCIVCPNPPAPSETFIQAHIDGLSTRLVVVHNGRPTVNGKPVLSLPEFALYRLARRWTGGGDNREVTAAYVKALRVHKIQVVLAEYGDTACSVLNACLRLRLPLVAHFHGYDASDRRTLKIHAEDYLSLFQRAAAIVAVSRSMQDRLVEMGAAAGKVHYNPCGVDCRQFSGARPSQSQPTFLAVGRFAEKKAPHLTLLAFAGVHRQRPESRLHMVGDGPLLGPCIALARSLGIADAVTFLGSQAPEVVKREMRSARAFVQHSVEAVSGDSEGTPVAVLEAGASGLPVISTRHGGIPDVVIHGETGFLVDECDVRGMTQHMIAVLTDPLMADRLGQSGRRRVESCFSAERSLSTLRAIIESVAGVRHSSRSREG
jgi:colanic acid/amylovoran biosynthesis glycosyltransferase